MTLRFAALLALLACSSGEDTSADEPVVLGTSPERGAVGVRPDAVVEIHFSEPMHAASVEAGFDAPLLGDGVRFSWPDARTLVVTPDQPLPVLSTATAERGQEVAYTIAADAESAVGTPLGEAFHGAFRVVRQDLRALPLEPQLSGRVAAGRSASECCLHVGDSADGDVYRTFMSFDATGLPPVVAVSEAWLSSTARADRGDPWDALGPLRITRVRYDDLHDDALFDLPVSGDAVVAPPPTEDDGSYAVDLTPIVADALLHRARVQVRLAFERPGDGDGVSDYAVLDAELPPELHVALWVE